MHVRNRGCFVIQFVLEQCWRCYQSFEYIQPIYFARFKMRLNWSMKYSQWPKQYESKCIYVSINLVKLSWNNTIAAAAAASIYFLIGMHWIVLFAAAAHFTANLLACQYAIVQCFGIIWFNFCTHDMAKQVCVQRLHRKKKEEREEASACAQKFNTKPKT